MKPRFVHPWWHWFFTHVIEWGSKTVMSNHRPTCDYVTFYCSKCDKYDKQEKWREYV